MRTAGQATVRICLASTFYGMRALRKKLDSDNGLIET